MFQGRLLAPPPILKVEFFHKRKAADSVEGVVDLLVCERVLAGIAESDDKRDRLSESVRSFCSVFVCVVGVAPADTTFRFLSSH